MTIIKIIWKKSKSLLLLIHKILIFPIVYNNLRNYKKNNFQIEIDYLNNLFQEKSIAIIWHWESLFNNEYGELIDSHDIVIRMNKWFPNIDIIKYTWKKTSIWFIWMFLDNINKHLKSDICYLSKYPVLEWNTQKHMTYSIIKNKRNNDLFFLSEDTYNKTLKIVNKWQIRKKFPTTWFVALYHFINNTEAKNIWIFGFTFWNTDHFAKTTNWLFHKHNLEAGKNYFFSHLNKGNVKFYT